MMTVMIFVMGLSILIFFQQDVAKYFQALTNRPYLMVCLLMLVLSYCSIRLYGQFRTFLIMMIYHVQHLKNAIQHMLPFGVSADCMAYFLNVVIITILFIGYAYYDLKHQSLIYKDQVTSVRQLVYIIFLMLMLIFSYEYDLRMYF